MTSTNSRRRSSAFSDIRPVNSDRTLQRSFWPVLIVLALGLMGFGPARLRRSIMPTERPRRGWMVVLATLVTAPLLVSSLKAVTHVFCPHELTR